MTVIDWLIGGVAGGAAIAAFGMYFFSVILRERRGAEAYTVTLATSRPIFTCALVLVSLSGIALAVLRLGVLS